LVFVCSHDHNYSKDEEKKDKEERNKPHDARLSSDGAAEMVIGGGRVKTS